MPHPTGSDEDSVPAAGRATPRTLSPAEKQAVSVGGETSPHRLDLLRERARSYVEEAIKTIPAEKKAAYEEALEKGPAVVAEESDPVFFVRTCDYDVWDAAERLLCYWRERKAIFGDERFFLPLDLSGEGALDHADVLSLRAGMYSILPGAEPTSDPCHDNEAENPEQGRVPLAVYCDRRQNLQSANSQTRLRNFFYFVNLLAKDGRSQSTGVMLLVLLVTPRMMEYDADFVRKRLWLFANAFPIKWKIHLLNCLPKSEQKRYAVQDTITSYASHVIDNYSSTLDVHIERYDGQLFQTLTEMGFPDHGIPDAVGGSWTHYQFQQWCQKRIADDRKAVKTKQRNHNTKGSAGASLNLSRRRTAEEKRTTNVLYSRRKRVRDKQQLASFQEKHRKASLENEELEAENERLQDLLRQANDVLREHSLPPPTARQEQDTTKTASIDDATETTRAGQQTCEEFLPVDVDPSMVYEM